MPIIQVVTKICNKEDCLSISFAVRNIKTENSAVDSRRQQTAAVDSRQQQTAGQSQSLVSRGKMCEQCGLVFQRSRHRLDKPQVVATRLVQTRCQSVKSCALVAETPAIAYYSFKYLLL